MLHFRLLSRGCPEDCKKRATFGTALLENAILHFRKWKFAFLEMQYCVSFWGAVPEYDAFGNLRDSLGTPLGQPFWNSFMGLVTAVPLSQAN